MFHFVIRVCGLSLCADIDGNKIAEVICYKPQMDTGPYLCYIGVFKWNGSINELEVKWVTSGSISNGAWSLNTTDRFFCVDSIYVDDNGNKKAAVVAFKQGDPCNNCSARTSLPI
jgi:hypothetical protein